MLDAVKDINSWTFQGMLKLYAVLPCHENIKYA